MYVDVVDKAEAFLMTRFLISYEFDPRTEREVNTTAPPKVTEGQGVTTDWEWVASTSPLNDIPIGLI